MNFIEYINHLKIKGLKATFTIKKYHYASGISTIGYNFEIPNAKLISNNIYSKIRSDSDYMSYDFECKLNETGEVSEEYNGFYHYDLESHSGISGFLDTAIYLMSKDMLQKYYKIEEFNGMYDTGEELFEETYLDFNYSDGDVNFSMSIDGTDIEDEAYLAKLEEEIKDAVYHNLGTEDGSVEASYAGAEEENIGGDYYKKEEPRKEIIEDLRDCFLSRFDLEFELIPSEEVVYRSFSEEV